MRRHLLCLLFSLVLAGASAASGLAQALDPNDDFDDGIIDTSKWEAYAEPGASIEEAGGKLVMSLPPSDWGEINLTAKWLLGGSFDIQADYELIDWPAHSGGTVGLLAMFPDDIEWDWVLRTSGRNPLGDHDELYLANVRTRYECICDGRVATSDTSGRFRLTRDDDSILTFYFWSTETADWVPIYTRTVPSDNVRIRLTCWGPVTSSEGVVVAFDNFQVNSGEIVTGRPVIEDVQITRGKWMDAWDWPTYYQKALVRVKEPEPGSTACFIIEEPTGGRYVYSMCAGGAWPDWYGSFPTNWDMWVVRHDDTTLTCGFSQRSILDKPPPSPFYIEVNDFTAEGTSLTTPDAPDIPEEAPVLLAPEPDSVIGTPVPTFEWANWTPDVDNWLQLKAEGSTYSTGTWDPDDHGEIWRAYVADQTSAVYNFYGSPSGPDLDPGCSYFWRLSSSRVEDDYTRDPCVRFTTTQIGQHRFTLDAEWPPLPDLPGMLAYAGMMWGDWSGFDFDSDAIRLYGPTVYDRGWLSSDYFARPNWSWDGSRLLYYRKDQGLWIDPLDGSMPWHIPVDAWGQQNWSPDNTRIVYGWVHLTPYWEIWTMNTDGADVQPLVLSDENDLRRAAWSPDGLWISYNSCCDASGYNVWLVRYDGSQTHPVVPTGLVGYPGWVVPWMAGDPAWSPDARQLSVNFYAESPDGSQSMEGVGIISREGGDITPLFASPPGIVCCAAPYALAWSPDGKSVVFRSGHHLPPDPEWPEGKFEPGVELFMIAADGSGEPLRLTYDYSMNMEANWWAPNTPVGHKVSIAKGDVSVTFTYVASEGSTRMTVTDEAPAPAPAPYTFVGELWDGATTAQVRGPITIAIHYGESLANQANSLKLLQWDGLCWKNITSDVDKEQRIISGTCSRLSTYVVAVKTKHT